MNNLTRQPLKNTFFLLRIVILLLLILLPANKSRAQFYEGALALPPTPEAMNLIKYEDIPVSYYTGIPDITVPIFNIEEKSLNVPVYLSYHAGGIKVDEIASWVGLGWSLNAGGMISRTVIGLSDESPNGYYYSAAFDDGNFQPESLINFYNYLPDDDFLEDVARGLIDTEPDIFYYNFLGYRGKFCFDGNGGIIVIPTEKIKITPTISSGNIISWEIVTPDGIIYTFGDSTYFDRIESKTYTAGNPIPEIHQPHNSTWYLTKIYDPNKDQTINFTYAWKPYTYNLAPSYSVMWNFLTNSYLQDGSQTICAKELKLEYSVSGYRLSGIESDNCLIEFKANTTRSDFVTRNQLDEIYIIDKHYNDTIKEVKFYYSYFDNGGGSCYNLRLRLDSINERNKNISLPPYIFTYSDIELPHRFSKQKDHWGYYNGASSNDNLTYNIPTTTIGSGTYQGTNREPDTSFIEACTLKKIKYPTGGEENFSFEANDYYYIGANAGIVNIETVTDTSYVEVGSDECDESWQAGAPTIDTIYISKGQYPDIYYRFSSTIGPEFHTVLKIKNSEGTEIWTKSFRDGLQVGSCFIEEGVVSTHYLSAGEYILEAEARFSGMYGKLRIEWEDEVISIRDTLSYSSNLASGLRIKSYKMDPKTEDGKIIYKKFNYHLQSDTLHSSGVLSFMPKYYTYINYYYDPAVGSYYHYPTVEATPYVKLYSSNIYPGQSNGNMVGYREVEVLEGVSGENGRTVYKYTSPYYYNDRCSYFFSSPLIESSEWKRGHMTEKLAYNSDDQLVSKDTLIYSNLSSSINRKVIRGFKAEYAWRGIAKIKGTGCIPGGVYFTDLADYNCDSYKVTSAWHYLASKISYKYFQQGDNPFVTSEEYLYDNPEHQQVTRIVTTDSKGDEKTIYRKYPLDYSTGTTDLYASAVTDMKSDDYYMHNYVIEEYKTIKPNGDPTETVSEGALIEYNNYNGKILPASRFKLGINNQSPFNESLINGSGNFIYDTDYYNEITGINYNSEGNIIELTLRDGIKKTYLYGYSNKKIVAVIENAEYKDCYFNSFENTDGNSEINDSWTGKYSRETAFTHEFSNLTNGYYCLTYRIKENPDWIYNKLIVNVTDGSYTINLTGQIDDLCFYPEKANIKTYTYDPLTGMTSETDPNGLTTYYEYDSFGRLKYIKDNDRNILKAYRYHYADQEQ